MIYFSILTHWWQSANRPWSIVFQFFRVLSGKAVVVSGWDDVELPDFADSEGTTPYTVSFSEDPALGLASANFALPVGAEQQSIAISLPSNLVNAVSSAVTDIFIVCDYKILAVNP